MNPTPLFDLETERRVIGAALEGAILQLAPSDFHDRRNQAVWKTVQTLQAASKPVSWETVVYEMDRPGDVALQAYLAQCMTDLASTLYAEEYAERLRDLAWRRGTILGMERVAKKIFDLEPRPAVETELLDAMGGGVTRGAAHRLDPDAVVEDFLRARAEPRDTWGLVTGIPQMDYELGGIHPGEVFLVAGLPKAGKSMLVSQMGFQLAGVRFYPLLAALGKTPGLMVHLEMTEEAIIRRAACAISHVSGHRVRTGKLSDEDAERFMDAVDVVRKAPVFIVGKGDCRGWTTGTVATEVRRLQRSEGIQWVIVDYAGMLSDGADMSSVERDILISQGLARIAAMGVAVIAVETLNKTGYAEDSPTAGAVRGSIQKTYDADVVSMLAGVKDNQEGRDLFIRMSREGAGGVKVPLRMIGTERRFELRRA